MAKTYRAGVIPYYIKDDEILMMFMKPSEPKFGGDVYQVAKGKVEEGETDEEAAFREANEELGLFQGNLILREELGVFLGRTTVFVAKIKDPDMFGEPHHETESTTWMTAEQFKEEGRKLHWPIVKAAVRKIEKIEKKQKELDEEYGDME